MRSKLYLSIAISLAPFALAACGSDAATTASNDLDASAADGTSGDATADVSSTHDAGSGDAASADASKSDASSDGATTNDGSASDASDGGSTTDGSSCGTCATGFSCGTGGYCVSATGVPQFGRVFVVVMENHSQSSVRGSASAPYINGLMNSYAYGTSYANVAHPSLPNYVAMTSGDTQGITCDCHPDPQLGACTAFCLIISSCGCNKAVAHLGDQLEAKSLEWREYAEGMGTPCNLADNGSYAAKHVPFLYYDNVRSNAARCAARTRDYGDFATDLAARTYRFSYVSPDLCHDMHDSCAPTNDSIKQGDDWLQTNMAPIITSLTGTDVLFIVWDEQDNSIGSAPVPFPSFRRSCGPDRRTRRRATTTTCSRRSKTVSACLASQAPSA